MAYYITGNGGKGKYYYGRVCNNMLTALILLDEAKRVMPGEEWAIKAVKI